MSDREPEGGGYLTRWWARLLAAAWVVGILVVYFQRQLTRVLEMAAR